MKHPTLFAEPAEPVSFVNRRTSDVTFKGKLSLPIHRWYRLTPSFSPQLALDIADHFGITPDGFVLDPFSGVGTVPLCMKYRGIPACSIELNPYLHFVGTVKTRTYADLPDIREFFDSFLVRAREEVAAIPKGKAVAGYLEENAQFIPPIHKPERWWSPMNLAQLTCIRRLLLNTEDTGEHIDLLKMGILGILIPVSNAKHNHVSLTFAKEPLPTVDVVGVLADKLGDIIDDIDAVSSLPCSEVKVYAGNSKEAASVLPRSPKVSAVITSPPYPNRFSYARETRPHLFFFNMIASAEAVGQLETDAIGGTWGKATSVLMDGVEPANAVVRKLMAPYLDIAHRDGNGHLMTAYVVKYFNDLYTHAEQIGKVCRARAKLAYVIGNSKFYGQPLPSDEILAGIFAHFGFALDGIHKMRRRVSKAGLYEAVVMMSRQ
ncbi:MAG: hypothetical protein IT437_13590 [Phycisphaerales bacterium]|nr:hypothetical protein [Phycisphaerales bacterium]